MTVRACSLLALLLALPLGAHAQKPQQSTPITQASATVSTGGTFQTALAANPNRTDCIIANRSADPGYVFWLPGGSATTANSLLLNPGDIFKCSGPSGVIRSLIQYTATTSSDAYMVGENN